MNLSIIDYLNLAFVQRAFIGGLLIAVCCGLLGIILVLKRYSMIGDGLSHVGFGALAIGAGASMTPMYIAIPIVIIAAFALLKLSTNSKIKGDSAIAMISTSSLALGVIILSVTSKGNSDIYNYMFGSILALTKGDLLLVSCLSIVVILVFVLMYNKIIAVTFDESFAKATGINTDLYNIIIAILTAITVVTGMKLMGAMLVSALLIFPSLSAMRFCRSFKGTTIWSLIISAVCLIFGLTFSIILDLPTGATIVVTNALSFLICSFIGKILHR